ncbi:MAG: hypothetical protein L0Y72_19800 [Gemmataceae bacterium]|nr:hypothetical protein [Gemmataceae bacterium]MCI0741282.1 hypothetical protein [Gemmataceae bacterium]
MRSPIVMPDVGAAASLSLWFVELGEQVYAGDRVVEILVDAATFDVSAPVTGKLIEKRFKPGDPVQAGLVLGFVEEETV